MNNLKILDKIKPESTTPVTENLHRGIGQKEKAFK